MQELAVWDIPVEDRTPEQNEALMIHNQVKIHKDMIGAGLAGLGNDLKQIRDKKLYQALGFSSFGEYTEQAHNIKERQAYKYIRVVEKYKIEFLHSSANSDIGVTKLLEIAVLDADERDQLFSEHTPEELSEMPTAEVKKLVAEIADLKKQISFLESRPTMPETVEQKPFDELQDEIKLELLDEVRQEYEDELRQEIETQADEKLEALKRELEELREKTVSDEEIKAIRAEAEREAKAAAAEESKQLKNELKAAKTAAKEKEEEAKKAAKEKLEAEERAKQAEQTAARAAELEAKVKTAEAERAAIEKQIRLSSDPELSRFKFMFENWQNTTAGLFEQLEKVDAEKQSGLKTAIKTVLEGYPL